MDSGWLISGHMLSVMYEVGPGGPGTMEVLIEVVVPGIHGVVGEQVVPDGHDGKMVSPGGPVIVVVVVEVVSMPGKQLEIEGQFEFSVEHPMGGKVIITGVQDDPETWDAHVAGKIVEVDVTGFVQDDPGPWDRHSVGRMVVLTVDGAGQDDPGTSGTHVVGTSVAVEVVVTVLPGWYMVRPGCWTVDCW